MFSVSTFNIVLIVMTVMAVVVFVSLFFVDAGYGRFYAPKWGPAIDNRLGWMLMEAPVFVAMLLLWWLSDRREDGIRLVFLLLFELHYFHRAFVFPWLMRGRSKMPLSIIGTAVLFNTLNAYMQGGWLFYVSPVDYYSADWLTSLPFLSGTALFLFGMMDGLCHPHLVGVRGRFCPLDLRQPGAAGGAHLQWVSAGISGAAGYPYHQTHHSLYFLNVSYSLSYFYAGENRPCDAQEPHYPLCGV